MESKGPRAIDLVAFAITPTRSQRERAGAGIRAEDALNAFLQDAGMPPTWRYSMGYDFGTGVATFTAVSGAHTAFSSGADFDDALQGLRRKITGEARSA